MKSVCLMRRFGLIALLCVFLVPGPAQAAVKDTLVYVMGAEPVSLDPPNQTDSMSVTVIQHIFDLPIHINAKGELVPGLFTKWEHSNGGRTWIFHLRKGVKFHDGTPFNAEAMKFNWERCTSAEKKVLRRAMFTGWAESVKALDEYTIQITSQEPLAPLLRALTHGAMAIVSPASVKKYGDQINRNPAGTGPFRFVEWKPGDRIVLERNPDFWGPAAKYKQLIFRFAKESSARAMMLETGEADLVLQVPPVDIDRLRKIPNVDVLVKPSNRVVGFYVNTTAPLVSDVRFRRALAYAIDKESIIKHVMKGVAQLCCSVIGGGTFGESTPSCYEYNPQKAKQLLNEVGYKGEKLQVWSPQGRYVMDRETSEAVQGNFQQAGINAELLVMEFASLDKGTHQPPEKMTYQLVLLGAAPGTGDGDLVLREFYHSSTIPPNGLNRSCYNNPEYDKLAAAQAAEMNEGKRKEFMKQCQDMLARDLPYIPLYTLTQQIGIRKNLKGVEVLPLERALVREAYFQE